MLFSIPLKMLPEENVVSGTHLSPTIYITVYIYIYMEWEQTPVKYTKMLKVVASGDGLLK